LIVTKTKQLFSLIKLPCDCEVPVIPVNRVVEKKRIIRKMEGPGGGEAQVVADQKNPDQSSNH
jgi:hypothetical protein